MEIWKDLPGSEGTYQVSNLGRIKSLEREVRRGQNIIMRLPEKVLSTRKHVGYENITLRIDGKTKVCSVHRLVAKTFLQNPNNYKAVNHIDGNKLNNNLSNLEWCSYSQNMKHAYKTGLKVAKNGAKLSAAQVAEIRTLCVSSNLTLKQIGERFGVSKAAISKIKNRKSWNND